MDTAFEDQLDVLARHVAHLETAPAEVWAAVALPLAAAVNALNEGSGAPLATADEPAVALARQLSHALRRRRVLAVA